MKKKLTVSVRPPGLYPRLNPAQILSLLDWSETAAEVTTAEPGSPSPLSHTGGSLIGVKSPRSSTRS